ncbi:hypothetical protein Tco_0910711 [Tanacetum coccineum]|uniref:Uncharacterized protein n=1 Tax=Tanacetum coccineum TaxID=301880 RepID=A0ABQ5CWX1_9ASTR
MILNSVQNGPLVWPTVVEEDDPTRTKKYEELSVAEKLQADCDLKATNIVLQGLPPDVYVLVNPHTLQKRVWAELCLLCKARKLSLQENECELYDEMRLVKCQYKFSGNSLPPKWSKFVTDVKLARDLYTTNYDQLAALCNLRKALKSYEKSRWSIAEISAMHFNLVYKDKDFMDMLPTGRLKFEDLISNYTSLWKATFHDFIYMTSEGLWILLVQNRLFNLKGDVIVHLAAALYMANNLEMDYTNVMPRRRWSHLDKKMSCIMIKDIDRQLLDRMLLRSLEKFVGGREYGEDLRLL